MLGKNSDNPQWSNPLDELVSHVIWFSQVMFWCVIFFIPSVILQGGMIIGQCCENIIQRLDNWVELG